MYTDAEHFRSIPLTLEGIPAAEGFSRSQGKLYSGFGWLDSVVGGFRPREMALIDSSSPFVFGLLSELCVQAVTGYGSEMIFVDGGNSIRPYEIARIAKLRGLDPYGVLPKINVARGFTAHQLAALINDRLEPALGRTGASTIVVSSILDLFMDRDMKWNESFQLLKRSMLELKRIAKRHDAVCIISNYGTGIYRTRALRSTMNDCPDRIVRMDSMGTGMRICLPRHGTYLYRYPVPQSQTVLDRYLRECNYGEDCRNL